MPPLRLHTRREAFVALLAAVTASVAVLGGAVLLFVDDGRTPWFDPASPLARDAQRCKDEPSAQARHRCLRELAQTAAREAAVTLRVPDPTLP